MWNLLCNGIHFCGFFFTAAFSFGSIPLKKYPFLENVGTPAATFLECGLRTIVCKGGGNDFGDDARAILCAKFAHLFFNEMSHI